MSNAPAPISFLIGRPYGLTTTAIGTVIFPRPRWKRPEAVDWLKRHGFKTASVETLRGSFRALQHPAGFFRKGTFRTIHTSGHAHPTHNPRRVMVPRHVFNQAVGLYRRFRERDPESIGVRTLHVPKMLMQVGRAHALEYFTTHRSGKLKLYRHQFALEAGPILAASANGKQLFFLGGHFDFTADGVVDRPGGKVPALLRQQAE